MGMSTAEIRRERLKQWFANRSVPEKEKSYMSQLMSGKASFGEKAARRIENDYGMESGYLDRPLQPSESDQHMAAPTKPDLAHFGQIDNSPINGITPVEVAELLSLYAKLNTKGRETIMHSLRVAASMFIQSPSNNKRKTR